MPSDFQLVQQINGDVRVDDGDEGPLLKLEFIAQFASMFSNEEKVEALEAACGKLEQILDEREEPEPEVNYRREAILAQRARRK